MARTDPSGRPKPIGWRITSRSLAVVAFERLTDRAKRLRPSAGAGTKPSLPRWLAPLARLAEKPWRRPAQLIAVVAAYAVGTGIARRRGYKVGGRVVVRCRKGHYFTTIWVPGLSLKAVRLGWARLQRCPVGNHWSLVVPVREADLTDEEKKSAAEHHDWPIP